MVQARREGETKEVMLSAVRFPSGPRPRVALVGLNTLQRAASKRPDREMGVGGRDNAFQSSAFRSIPRPLFFLCRSSFVLDFSSAHHFFLNSFCHSCTRSFLRSLVHRGGPPVSCVEEVHKCPSSSCHC